MKHRILPLLALCATVVAACAPATAPSPNATAAPGSAATSPAETRSSNQIFKVGKTGLPATASPESSALNNEVMATVFDSVLQFGKNFAIEPGVAEKWQVMPEANTWRFTIRKDLTFSNGDKLTADDVAYSINLIVEKKLPQLATISLVEKANAVDPTTVDVVSKGLDATLLNALPGVFVLPAKAHQAMSSEQFGAKPIGSGPYVLSEFKPGDRMVFTKRPTDHPYRKVNFTEIDFLAIPELVQLVNGLRGGEIDLIGGAFNVEQVNTLKNAGFITYNKPSGVATALFTQPEAELRNSPITNKKVRQALQYAVNRQAMANALFKGFAEPAGQISLPDSPFYDPSVKPIPYDVAKAKQLLAEAGYPNGFKLDGGIEFSPFSSSPDIVTLLQGALHDVGVETPVKQYEQAVFSVRALRATEPRGDILMLTVNDANGTWSQLPNLFDCSKQGFLRWWCNEEYDKLFIQSRTEPDAAKRADLVKKALAILNDDEPYILTASVPNFILTSPKIKGFDWTTRAFYDFDSAYRIN